MLFNALHHVYAHPLLKNEALKTLVDAHQAVDFNKGDLILKEGKIANDYFILQTGLVRSFVYDYTGNDITTNFFTDCNVVVEVSSLFQRVPSQENIIALTDCKAWKMSFDIFQQLFHSIEGVREWGRAWMSGQLFAFKQRSVKMITDTATQRYMDLLKEKPLVVQQAPLKHIATYLGITDTSLSRIRKEIADK